MSAPHDDWRDWKRLHAIEWTPEPPRRRWRTLLELLVLVAVVATLGGLAARCARPTPPVPWREAEQAQRHVDSAVAKVAQKQARSAATRARVASAVTAAESLQAVVALRKPAPIGTVWREAYDSERTRRETLEHHAAALESELVVMRDALEAALASAAAWRAVAETERCRLLWWYCPSRTQVAVGGLVIGLAAGLAAGR